ncbi:MAG: MFS transporter [Acidimicrobiales bacterium]
MAGPAPEHSAGPGSEEPRDPESATDALVDADVAYSRGTAQAALSHRDFRVVWSGTFASNVGTWMQNVLLGAYGYELTHSATFVGLLFFAQLGPLLFLATLGGVLADVVDRRRLLVWTQLEQLALSVVLAVLAALPHPSRTALVLCVLAIGVGNALSAPGISAILPTLVPRQDLPGAVSLQSVQTNLSRVIGPAIGAPIYARFGPSPVFAINAATYLFAVTALLVARYPRKTGAIMAERGAARLLSGFRLAWQDRLVRRILATMTSFSLFSLAFVGLMPAIAARNFGIRPKSLQYGLLYAIFGLGAALGAVMVGTLLVRRSKARLARGGLLAFAGLLGAFALVRSPGPAYPLAVALGFAYFVVITSLSTVLQEHLRDEVRGRIMALWIMSFGGAVPVGVLAGGWLANRTDITDVLLVGVGAAVVLCFAADLVAVGAPG